MNSRGGLNTVDDLGRKTSRASILSRISKTSGYNGGQQPNRSGEIPVIGRLQGRMLLGKIGDTYLMEGRMAYSLLLCPLGGGSMLQIDRSQRPTTQLWMSPGHLTTLSLVSLISPLPSPQWRTPLLLPSLKGRNVPSQPGTAAHQSGTACKGLRSSESNVLAAYKHCH